MLYILMKYSLLNNLNRTFSLLSYHTFAIPQLTSKVSDNADWIMRILLKIAIFCHAYL